MKCLNDLKEGDIAYYARPISLSYKLRKVLPAKILKIYTHTGFNGKLLKIFDLKVIDLDYQKSEGFVKVYVYSWKLYQPSTDNFSTNYQSLKDKLHE